MEKIFKDVEIFYKSADSPIDCKEYKHLLQDGDIVHAGYEEPEESYDGYYYVSITRKVLETDEQLAKRIKDKELQDKWAKERRYESYLKLKEEFENDVK